jgi:hypothetical protein
VDSTQHALASLLALAGLIGGTIEYIEVIRRRERRRQLAADYRLMEDSGLRGLVRLFAASDGEA